VARQEGSERDDAVARLAVLREECGVEQGRAHRRARPREDAAHSVQPLLQRALLCRGEARDRQDEGVEPVGRRDRQYGLHDESLALLPAWRREGEGARERRPAAAVTQPGHPGRVGVERRLVEARVQERWEQPRRADQPGRQAPREVMGALAQERRQGTPLAAVERRRLALVHLPRGEHRLGSVERGAGHVHFK